MRRPIGKPLNAPLQKPGGEGEGGAGANRQSDRGVEDPKVQLARKS